MRSALAVAVVAAIVIAGCGSTVTRTVTVTNTVTRTVAVKQTASATVRPVSPPSLTNQNGIYIIFSGPDADELAGDFQHGAAKAGTYWSTFVPGPAMNATVACQLRYGRDQAQVDKANSALEDGSEGRLCAGLLSDGWHQ